jgi:hypothetical protein
MDGDGHGRGKERRGEKRRIPRSSSCSLLSSALINNDIDKQAYVVSKLQYSTVQQMAGRDRVGCLCPQHNTSLAKKVQDASFKFAAYPAKCRENHFDCITESPGSIV